MPCDGPRMNPSVDVGNPPRPFRHLRMTERRTPDPSSSRVPVHSALVQKSVTAITNLVGRLSTWMLGKTRRMRKGKLQKRWQSACNQSNHVRDSGLARYPRSRISPAESCAASGPARTFVYKPDQDHAIPISVRFMSCSIPSPPEAAIQPPVACGKLRIRVRQDFSG